jgi:TrmH family RNA methyltransferase
MLTKNHLKYFIQLSQKKFRDEQKKFVVEGDKLILEALTHGFECDLLLATHNFYESNSTLFEHRLINKQEIKIIKKNELEKIADAKTPQEILGIFQLPIVSLPDFSKQKLIALLENISDPGNMGTILRNCDWFGIKSVFTSSGSADIYNPKVIRAAAGSIFHLNIFQNVNLTDQIKNLKKSGYTILCADLNGKNIYEFIVPLKSAVIFSSEAHGPSKEILSISDYTITIPRKGKAESLNVASASAVLLSFLSK